MKVLMGLFVLLTVSVVNGKEVIGLIQGKDEVLIKSKSQGELKEIYIKEGEAVKKGDVIAKLDDKKEQVELELAIAEYEAAKKDYNSSEELKKFLSKEELTKKKNDYLRKKANFKLKMIALQAKQFISPIDGIVARKFINLNETISSGEKSFEVINMKDLIIDLDIEAKKTSGLKIGKILDFKTELHPEQVFQASIFHVGSVLDKSSGTIKVKLKLANKKIDNKTFLFKPGTMINVLLK